MVKSMVVISVFAVLAILGQYMCSCEANENLAKRLSKRSGGGYGGSYGSGYGGYNMGYGNGYNSYQQIPNIYINSATDISNKFNTLVISTLSTALWYAVAKYT